MQGPRNRFNSRAALSYVGSALLLGGGMVSLASTPIVPANTSQGDCTGCGENHVTKPCLGGDGQWCNPNLGCNLCNCHSRVHYWPTPATFGYFFSTTYKCT